METQTNFLEVRTTVTDLEFRAAEGDKPNQMVGYAIVWNSLSGDLGGFYERVLPGATRTSLANNDIRALVNHDPDKLLGRTSSQTLRLAEDAHGLRVECDLPDTSYANDLKVLMKRGDAKGMSFAFVVPPDGQRFLKEDTRTVRELSNINLSEVTAVLSKPAYDATSLSLRVDPSVVRYISDQSSRPNSVRCRRDFRNTLVKG